MYIVCVYVCVCGRQDGNGGGDHGKQGAGDEGGWADRGGGGGGGGERRDGRRGGSGGGGGERRQFWLNELAAVPAQCFNRMLDPGEENVDCGELVEGLGFSLGYV
jgi:hypothetical protein